MKPLEIKVIPYEYIVSESMKMFFDNHQHSFFKENGQYIFLANINKKVLSNILLTYLNTIITEQFSLNLHTIDTLYIICDNCYPHMNWRRNQYVNDVSSEARKFIIRETMLKYLLKERDIKIDELTLNIAFEEQFDDFFRDASRVLTILGVNNIIFFKNIFMSEHDLFNTIRDVFGKHNVKHQFHFKKDIKHIINANNLVYRDKAIMNAKPPEELASTCHQVIDIMFSKLFNSEG